MSITLPTEPTPPTRKSPRFTVIYGPPKVGKTTAISQLKGCLDIDLENGADFLTALKIKANSWPELQEIIQAIKSQGKPYKYIAIDTTSRMEEWAEIEATTRYRASVIGKTFKGNSVLDLPNGNGYRNLRDTFLEMIMLCCSAADNVIFVSHLRDKMLAGELQKTGTSVSAKDLDLTGKCKQIICSIADAIGYIYRTTDGNTSVLNISFKSSEMVNCGSRCEHLKGMDIPLDWSKIFID